MSRVDSARIASIKAENAGLTLRGSAVASDAFFPFRDGLDVVVAAGANCVIQPGGSVRDDEVIAAADEHDIAMVLTGTVTSATDAHPRRRSRLAPHRLRRHRRRRIAPALRRQRHGRGAAGNTGWPTG